MKTVEILSEKPETLVKYGKVIITRDEWECEKEIKETLNNTQVEKNNQKILNVILPVMYFKNEQGQTCY